MGAADYYKPGGWNLCDDKSGFKIKNTASRVQWDNIITAGRHWDFRHEQDFLRATHDRQAVPDVRPDTGDEVFITTPNTLNSSGIAE